MPLRREKRKPCPPFRSNRLRNLIELRQLGLTGFDFQVLWARAFYFENESRPEMAAATYDEIRLLWREGEDRHLALSGLLFAAAFYADNDRPSDTADCLDLLQSPICRQPPFCANFGHNEQILCA